MIDQQLLQDIEFFELHDEDDRKSLAKVLDHIRFPQGSRLFERGDRGNELYIVSQNQQAEKDRVRSNIDYEVNFKAEVEVAFLHEKTDRLYEKMQEQFSRLEKAVLASRTEESLRKGIDND